MWFRQWNEQKNDFDPEQIKIINNQIVFSDDGFKSAKMAIGKIPIDKNGNTVYAVNAEAILGKLFLGEYLTLQNNSGTYKFDDDGFIAKGGNNSVRIQPNQSGELFSIYKGNNKQFYVDSDGNVHFTGDLTGSSGIFSGQLKGGSINLGNGTFMVDKNGNVFANNGTFGGNCTFKGTLDGADGSFSGKVNASSGTIGGWNIGETSLYSGYINTSIGYMNAVLSPGGLSFDLLGQNNTMIINALNIGWDSNDLCSLIKRDSITTQELSLKQLNFIMLSNPKITCPSGYLTFDTTNNVHFKNTPYIDNYSSYLAREEWCNDKFALKTDLSGYTTNSHLEDRLDDIKSWVRNNYATKSWCNSTFKKK